MKLSYNWLKDYLPTTLSPEEIAEILTDTGLETEGIDRFETVKGGLEGVVIGEILEIEKHPDADRLNITKVNVGNETLQIVCGASNVAVGQKVTVSLVGSTLYPNSGEEFKIKKSKIRGVESFGMICAEDELGLGESHDGIMVLENSAKAGSSAADYFNLKTDFVLEIGLTPNRTDGFSHFGAARDIAARLNLKSKTRAILPDVSEYKTDSNNYQIKINVENSEDCPRYSGVTLANVEVKPSPEWLQNRLRAIGLKPVNNVVDITNFVLHETGHPLHAFDADKIKGKNIIVKTLAAKTKFTTLDGTERELSENDLMICDEEKPLCIAGVLGGLNSGVSADTKNVFLESAYFNPVRIRKSARRHALNTDASFRFERGVDPNDTIYVLKRAALLIRELAGAEISSEIQDLYPNPIEGYAVSFNLNKCNALIGQEIPKVTILTILESLDIKVTEDSGNDLQLLVPTYRADVLREIDVIEEILRIYGFNEIALPEKLNSSISYSPKIDKEKIRNKIADFLASKGLLEMMSNSLTKAGYAEMFKNDNVVSEHSVKILNPLSSELNVMRQSLLGNALEAVLYNQNRRNADLSLFEFGKIYRHFPEKGYFEEEHLSIILTGQKEDENWNNNSSAVGFSEIKGLVENVFEKLGLTKILKGNSLENPIFGNGLSFGFKNQTLVEFGWINDKITADFDIKNRVYFADFNWTLITDFLYMNKVKYTDIPKYPAVRRDVSLLIDKNITFESIEKLVRKSEPKLIKEVGLFDVYDGKNLPAEKKSYAISIILQDENKTLEDKQIDKVMDKIRQTLEKQLGAELR